MSLSARRITWLISFGAVLSCLLLLVIADPTFHILIWIGVLVVFVITLYATWTSRQPLLAWHRRFTPAVRVLLLGCFVWLFCFVWFFTIQNRIIRFPDFIHYSSLFGLLNVTCGMLSLPLSLGGWLLVWGDNGPPHPIYGSIVLNILCGVALTTSLSATMFSVVHRIKKRRSIG